MSFNNVVLNFISLILGAVNDAPDVDHLHAMIDNLAGGSQASSPANMRSSRTSSRLNVENTVASTSSDKGDSDVQNEEIPIPESSMTKDANFDEDHDSHSPSLPKITPPTTSPKTTSAFRDKICPMGGYFDNDALKHPEMYPDGDVQIVIDKVEGKEDQLPRVGWVHRTNHGKSSCLGVFMCPMFGNQSHYKPATTSKHVGLWSVCVHVCRVFGFGLSTVVHTAGNQCLS